MGLWTVKLSVVDSERNPDIYQVDSKMDVDSEIAALWTVKLMWKVKKSNQSTIWGTDLCLLHHITVIVYVVHG